MGSTVMLRIQKINWVISVSFVAGDINFQIDKIAEEDNEKKRLFKHHNLNYKLSLNAFVLLLNICEISLFCNAVINSQKEWFINNHSYYVITIYYITFYS